MNAREKRRQEEVGRLLRLARSRSEDHDSQGRPLGRTLTQRRVADLVYDRFCQDLSHVISDKEISFYETGRREVPDHVLLMLLEVYTRHGGIEDSIEVNHILLRAHPDALPIQQREFDRWRGLKAPSVRVPTAHKSSNLGLVWRDDYLSRPRLLERLRDGLHRGLAWIIAPGGYGKTVLLADFFRAPDMPVIYYKCHPSRRHVSSFMLSVAEEARNVFPAFGGPLQEVLQLQGRERQVVSAEHATTLMLTALQEVQSDLVLVLDDFYLLGEGPAVEIVENIIQERPPSLRFVIASRAAPSLATGDVALSPIVIHDREIAFSQAEIESYAHLLGLELDHRLLALLDQGGQGWPVYVDQMFRELRARPSLISHTCTVETISQVFSGRLRRLAPEEQALLLHAALLDPIDPLLCNHLTGQDSAAVLDRLEAEGTLPISHLWKQGRKFYQFHPLLREFLGQNLQQSSDSSAVLQVYQQCAHYYRQGKTWEDWYEAVKYLCAAREHSRAAAFLLDKGNALIEQGMHEVVLELIGEFPPDWLRRRTRLLALWGRCLLMEEKMHAAKEALDQAVYQGKRRGVDPADLAEYCFDLGKTYYYLHEAHKGLELLQDVLPQIEDPIKRAQNLSIQSVNYTLLDDRKNAISCARRAHDEIYRVPPGEQRARALVRASTSLAFPYTWAGQVNQALETMLPVAEMLESGTVRSIEAGRAYHTLGFIYVVRGEWPEGIQALEKALDYIRQYNYPGPDWAYLWLAIAYRDMGLFDRSEDYFSKHGPGYGYERAFLRLRQGRVAEGLELAKNELGPEEQEINPARQYLKARQRAVLGIAYKENGLLEQAEPPLKRGLAYYIDTEGWLWAASIALHLAHLGLVRKDPAQCGRYLDQAIGLAEGKFYHFLLWDPQVIGDLCQWAEKEGRWAGYTSILKDRLSDALGMKEG